MQILYFAAVRDLVGREEESAELPAEVRTVSDFVAWVAAWHAPLAGRLASVRVARNESFARGDDELANGDVLALIPPVAGG